MKIYSTAFVNSAGIKQTEVEQFTKDTTEIGLGNNAGTNQGSNSIAIGNNAGTTQMDACVASR